MESFRRKTKPNKQPLHPFKILVILLYGTYPWLVRRIEGSEMEVLVSSAKLIRKVKRPVVDLWAKLDFLQELGVVLSWSRPAPGKVRLRIRMPQEGPKSGF